MDKITPTSVLRKRQPNRWLLFSLVLALGMLLLSSCDNGLQLKDDEVSAVHISRSFVPGDIPLELTTEERATFIELLNQLELEKKSNYEHEGLVPDGGSYKFRIDREEEELELIDIGLNQVLLPSDAKLTEVGESLLIDSCYLCEDQEAFDELNEFIVSLYEETSS